MKANEDVQDLVEQLQQARDAYYNDAPFISDAEFDALEDQLRSLDPANEYFAAVGAKPTSGWKKVKHNAPMGSLKKAQTLEELHAWHSGGIGCTRDEVLVVSEKLDGISISLVYKNGKLLRAVTRGDGEIGEDITRNVLLMQGVEREIFAGHGKRIKGFSGHIRGEIILPRSNHEKYLKADYKNPRNAAAGIAKREHDPSLCKHLHVMCYQALPDNHSFVDKVDELNWLGDMHFLVPNWSTTNLADIEDTYHNYIDGERAELDYDIDGLVVELNDLIAMADLGEQDGRPRGARALKFPHEQQPTVLRDIVWQVGPSGRITPVAYFDGVSLAGVTVSQASLHNVDNIMRLWSTDHYPKVGDTILVSRRNDVIPYVEKVITKSRTKGVLSACHECPSCASEVTLEGAYVVCKNSACPAQQSGAIKRWVKKLGIKEWGDALIDALCACGVESIADLYRLRVTDIEDVELSGRRLGKSKAGKALANLDKNMELHLADFIGALGIDLCGQTICQTIVDAGFDTLEKMQDASIANIAAIPGMGVVRADAFVRGLHARHKLIADILRVGVKIKKPAGGPLTGVSFCFTGVRSKVLEAKIKDASGIIKSSVSKDLTYLVAKDPKSTSGKAQKAKEYGVKIIGLAELEKLLL